MADKKQTLRPIGDKVVVEVIDEPQTTLSGIVLPDSAKEKSQRGKVIAVGTGKLDDSGKKIPFNVKKGDKILLPKYGGTEVKIDDKDYQIVREDDILGIIE